MISTNRTELLTLAPSEVWASLTSILVKEGDVQLIYTQTSFPAEFPHSLAVDLLNTLDVAPLRRVLRMFNNPETIEYAVRTCHLPSERDGVNLAYNDKVSLDSIGTFVDRGVFAPRSPELLAVVFSRFGMDGYRKVFGDDPFWIVMGSPGFGADAPFETLVDCIADRLEHLGVKHLARAVDAVVLLSDLLDTAGVSRKGRLNADACLKKFGILATNVIYSSPERLPSFQKLEAAGLYTLRLDDLTPTELSRVLNEKLGTDRVAWMTALELMDNWDYDKGSADDLIETALSVASK